MRKFSNCLATIVALLSFNLKNSGDSFYLTNSRPIVTSSKSINQIKASDKVVAWQEYELLPPPRMGTILKALDIGTGKTYPIATTAISFASIRIEEDRVAWLDSRQADSYFTWNPSQGTTKTSLPDTTIKAIQLLSEGILYEGSNKDGLHIAYNKFDGTTKIFQYKNLLGADTNSFIIDNSLEDNTASLLKIDLEAQTSKPWYKSSASKSYIASTISGVHQNGNTSAWVVGERLPGLNTIEYVVTYHDGEVAFPIVRINSGSTQIDLTEKGIFWNQWNATKRKNELYNWSPIKGNSFLSDKVTTPVYKFAVNGDKVYISNTNTLYQADIVEYPVIAPDFTMHKVSGDQQSLEFRVKNPVQGKTYTLQTSLGLPGNWGDLSKVQTGFQITKDNSSSAVQFIYNPPAIEPQQFFRIKVDTP